jgi:DNA-binding NtrC family response regulator
MSIDEPIFGPSQEMRAVLELIDKVAAAPSTPVLIEGESGTGKRLCAARIHQHTPGRSEGALVEMDCSSVSPAALERELEVARGGTLFLDDIAALPPETQARLLSALDGSGDVRVIAATPPDVRRQVWTGQLRPDLFQRLDVFHLLLPRLCDRRDDILPLARHFLERFAARTGKAITGLQPQAETILTRHSYPGNVRELRNLIERAVILETGPEVSASSIVLSGGDGPAGPSPFPFFWIDRRSDGNPPSLGDLERAYIVRLLDYTGGNRTRAARLLGVSYPTLVRKIADYGIPLERH